MKNGSRIIAITSGPFIRKTGTKTNKSIKISLKNKKILTVGVIGRKNVVEGIVSTYIDIDGSDSTDKIIKMIKHSRFFSQIKLIALNGIALAGLNIVDIYQLKKQLKLDALIITRNKPRPNKLINALKTAAKQNRTNSENENNKIKIDQINKYKNEHIFYEKNFYIQTALDLENIKNIVEPAIALLRLSHLIARGVQTGESKGRL